MLKKHMTQSYTDARDLKSLTRLAIRTLKSAHKKLQRRGAHGAYLYKGWDGPDAKENEKLQDKVAKAIEPLDEYLDNVSTRRALSRQREPSGKETKSTRYARKCEKVAGRALATLLELQEELDNGDWFDAFKTARDGARDLYRDLDDLGTLRVLLKSPSEGEAPAPAPQEPVVEVAGSEQELGEHGEELTQEEIEAINSMPTPPVVIDPSTPPVKKEDAA
ncbi:MAG TPA: hypothetical protein VFF73_40320 [Planctomycetota bacterium]|nr:hypothetical protein [Planctomycetota bacterium]